MVKKVIFLSVAFFVLTKVVFGINSSLNGNITDTNIINVYQKESEVVTTTPNPEDPFIFAALPAYDKELKTSVKTADARPELIRQYLEKYDSPLEPHSNLIVELSDQNNFDYRWLVAIAMQESNLCRRIPENSYNCWGWGIYGDKVTRFDSYEDALRRIAPQFTRIFLQGKHYKDPMEVMKTYTPPSDGSWANGVSIFFNSLD